MSVLGKLLHRGDSDQSEATATIDCAHTTLVPRWDFASDMGNEAKASGYACTACQQTFTVAEGRALQEAFTSRLHRIS